VSATLFKLDEDVLIDVMYIPPEFISYSSQEAFNDIDFDIRNVSRSYQYISLAGDFNARTAELKDFSVFTKNDFQNGTEWRVNIRKTFTKIKYSQIINTLDKIWRTNEIIYSTCIPASKFTYITITSYSSVHDKQVLSLAKIY
jgi:hypothetical protein